MMMTTMLNQRNTASDTRCETLRTHSPRQNPMRQKKTNYRDGGGIFKGEDICIVWYIVQFVKKHIFKSLWFQSFLTEWTTGSYRSYFLCACIAPSWECLSVLARRSYCCRLCCSCNLCLFAFLLVCYRNLSVGCRALKCDLFTIRSNAVRRDFLTSSELFRYHHERCELRLYVVSLFRSSHTVHNRIHESLVQYLQLAAQLGW